MTAQCSPPPSEPAKRWFLRPSAIGGWRLDHLESISMRPSSRTSKTVPARERIADRPRDGRLAGDGGKLDFEPEMQVIDERFCAPLPRLAAFIGGEAANVGFEGIERGDADHGLGGDRRRRIGLDLVELPPHMAPAESERDVTALSELRIGAIAIDLQDAAEAREMLGRPRMLAIGGIDIGSAWRGAAGPGPLVARIGPQLALLDAPASGIEHRRRRLVGEQLGRLLQLLQEPRVHRP